MDCAFSPSVDGVVVTDEGDTGKRYDGMTAASLANASVFSVGFVLSTSNLLPQIGMPGALLSGMPIFGLLPAATYPRKGHRFAVRRERTAEPTCAVSELQFAIAQQATGDVKKHHS